MYEYYCIDNKQSNQIAFLRINFTFEDIFNQVQFQCCYICWMYTNSVLKVKQVSYQRDFTTDVVHHNNHINIWHPKKVYKCLYFEQHIVL